MSLLLETDEAQMAEQAGYDPGDPAEFLEAMLAIKDSEPFRQVVEYLADKGLTVGSLQDLMIDAVLAESQAEKSSAGTMVVSKEARHMVTQLAVRGFPSSTIARLLDVEQERVDSYLRFRAAKQNEPRIVEMHNAGLHISDIARQLGTTYDSVRKVLVRLGMTPHKKNARLAADVEARILNERARGRSRPEIAAACGVRPDQVDNVVRAAARRGQVSDYGRKQVA